MEQHEMTREHAMEHMYTPQNSLAVGATRYGHDLTRRLSQGKMMGGERNPGYGSLAKVLNRCLLKLQESSSSRNADIRASTFVPRMSRGRLALPELRHVRRSIFCARSTRCLRDGTPALESSCTVERKIAFCLVCSRVGCLGFRSDTNR